MQLPFIPGLKLSELLYREAVAPILERQIPDLCYSAARLGYGSDVLGFDTQQSRDHGWGPQLTLFLPADAPLDLCHQITQLLADHLPLTIHSYPTHFSGQDNEAVPQAVEHGPVNHWVRVTTIQDFFTSYIGINPLTGIALHDWLLLPPQRLRTIASGRIFYDGLSQLHAVQEQLRWYPHDVWLYLIANQWQRISQEEPFVGRCGDVSDELGSRIVATRLIDDIIRLCFLFERQYPPYYKWFGTAFSHLQCAPKLTPIFHRVLDGAGWQVREQHLAEAYHLVGELHNEINLTPYIDSQVSPFFSRPYLVPHADRFVEALFEQIQSPEVRKWPKHIGAVDQFVNSTDILENVQICRSFEHLYRENN